MHELAGQLTKSVAGMPLGAMVLARATWHVVQAVPYTPSMSATIIPHQYNFTAD
jgi:hypothetical protein